MFPCSHNPVQGRWAAIFRVVNTGRSSGFDQSHFRGDSGGAAGRREHLAGNEFGGIALCACRCGHRGGDRVGHFGIWWSAASA